jgi:formylglycine-generating enzyme required for sulfatase activity
MLLSQSKSAAKLRSAQMPDTFVNSIGIKLVRIEPGSFLMGQEKGGDWDERPVHKVNISKQFYIATTEVTNAQYEQFDPKHRKLRGKSGLSKEDDEAVVFVSWHEATKFCKWLSKKERKRYRLPTEAEWEYACRAGTPTVYYTGNALPDVYHKNQTQTWQPKPVSLQVAKTPANKWGLHDMHGNVEEWCYDWYGPYEQAEQADPVGRVGSDFKVTRGGSHNTKVPFLRSANRLGTLPQDKSSMIGFRVVLGKMPKRKPLPVPPLPLNQRNVSQRIPTDLTKGPDPKKPYFKGPIEYVKVPRGSNGPMYSKHNHDPALVDYGNRPRFSGMARIGMTMHRRCGTMAEGGSYITSTAFRLRPPGAISLW